MEVRDTRRWMSLETRTTERHELSPNLVRAWFDTVLNPLLRGLAMEVTALAERNLTWRFPAAQFASLVPVKQHIPAEAWDNWEQILSLYPECAAPAQEHDGKLQRLHDACRSFESRLVESDVLRRALDQVAASGNDLEGVFYISSPSDHP